MYEPAEISTELAAMFADANIATIGQTYQILDIAWDKRNRVVDWKDDDNCEQVVHFTGIDKNDMSTLYFIFRTIDNVYVGFENGDEPRRITFLEIFPYDGSRRTYSKINNLVEELKAKCPNYHNHQQVYLNENGTIRFRPNKIVDWLLENASKHGYDLNRIACENFDREDQIQFAQLIGYSVYGWGTLSYCDDVVYEQVTSTKEYKKLVKSLDKSE